MVNIESAAPYPSKDGEPLSMELPSPERVIGKFAEAVAGERIGGVYIPNPKRFAQGFIDGFKSTGLGLGAIAYNIIEHPEATKDIFAQDLAAAVENPREFFGEHGDLIAEGVEAWWEKKKADKFDDFSYDTGAMVGTLAPRILTHGVASTENLGEIVPGIGRPERITFLGGLIKEEAFAGIEKKVPGSTQFLNKLWVEFERRINQCVDPKKMDKYADALKNLFLHRASPEEHSIKPDTLKFVRDELLESVYALVQNKELSLDSIALFIGAFSVLIQASQPNLGLAMQTLSGLAGEDLRPQALEPSANAIEMYLDEKPISETEKNTFIISQRAIQKSRESKELPPKEVIIQLTDALIKRLA